MLNKLVIFYVFFLNLFCNINIINKFKYAMYISISLLCCLWLLKNINNIKIKKKNDLMVSFIIFMIITIPGTLYMLLYTTGNDTISAYIRSWIFLPIIMYIYFSKYTYSVKSLIIYSIPVNMFSIIELINNISSFGRIKGIFSHPNFYSFYIIVIILSILYCMNSKIIKKIHGNIYIIVNIIMLLASGSKTALIASVISVMYYYIEYLNKMNVDKKVLMLLISIAILVLIILLFGDRFKELRIFNLEYGVQDNQVNSFDWRILKWQTTLSEWKNSIFGIIFGYGKQSELMYGLKGYTMHNEYLRILFNFGILGSLVILRITIILKNRIRRINQVNKKNFYTAILITILIGCLCENIFISAETYALFIALLFSIDCII